MSQIREPKQDRSRRRHDALLQAAVELIAEGGPAAVTHRAVAIRAGVPASTAGYFFASIDDLTAEALTTYTEQSAAEFHLLGQSADGAAATIDDLIDAVARHRDDPEVAAAQIATYLEARRNPALRALVGATIDTYRRVAEELLVARGVPSPEAVAPAIVALLDGFMLHTVAKPDDPPDATAIAHALQVLLAGHLLDDTERYALRTRLRP